MAFFISALAVATVILFAIYVYKQSIGFVVENYRFESNKVKSDFNFVFLSDLHERKYGEKNADLLRAIDDCNPEYVIIGGDFLTKDRLIDDKYYDTLELIKRISDKYPTLFAPGNHERMLYTVRDKLDVEIKKGTHDESDVERCNGLDKVLEESQVIKLRDDSYLIEEKGIRVYGLDMPMRYYRRLVRRVPQQSFFADKLGQCDDKNYTILLAHDPEHFEEYAQWGPNLVLSGHIHGGIVRLPFLGGVISPQLKLFPKYDSGTFSYLDSDMLVSRGVGSHTFHIRLWNKAEICNVTIKKTV